MKASLPAPRLAVGLAAAAVLTEFALLAAWQRTGYVGFSDGVYALSAREFLHGLVPYKDFAAAQPPPIFLLGAGLLGIHDGLASLRAGLAALDLITAALCGWSVWRISASRGLAWAAGFAAPLLPLSLYEHAQLVPETLAAPLVLGGALWCARAPRAGWGGALLAVASLCKLAFGFPALAIALVSVRRRTSFAALALTGAAAAAVSLAAFGTAVWREAITAQFQVGTPSLHYAGGLLAQAAWSELALVIGAGAAVWFWTRNPGLTGAPELVRTLAVAAGAGLLLALTVFKRGSYINVLAVAEPPLLVLAMCGAAWAWRRSRPGRSAVVLLSALLAAQSVSILANPENPPVAKRPGAGSGLAWVAGPAAVDRVVAVALRCPRRYAYSGDPYYAFLAHRRMPGNQPDPFMLGHAAADARFARRAARDVPRCP